MTTQNAKLEQLLDLVEGRLSQDQALRLTAEIDDDPELRAAHEWVRNFRSMAERTTLVSAPASTRAMLSGLLPEPRTASKAVDQLIEFVGRMVRDVPAGPAFAGARGVSLDSKRQLMFDAGDDTDIAIELHLAGDVLRVSGQLLADDPTGAVLMTTDQSTVDLVADDYGEFSTTIPLPAALQLTITTTLKRTHLDLTPYLDPAGSAPHGTT